MRDAGERERKKEKERIFFNERSLIKYYYFFFSFLLQCTAIFVVHYSKKLKNFSYGSAILTCIFVFW